MEEIILTVKITLAVQVSSFKVHLHEITIYYKNTQNVSTGSGLIGRLTFKHTQIGKITTVLKILRIDL